MRPRPQRLLNLPVALSREISYMASTVASTALRLVLISSLAVRSAQQSVCDSSTSTTCAPGCFPASNLDAYSSVTYIICMQCPPGSSCSDGTALPQTCPSGYFSTLQSTSCAGPCDAGTLTPPGSSFCGPPCPAGTWSDSFTSCTTCSPGTFNSYVGTSSAAACVSCPDGYFASNNGAAFCTPCPLGETNSADRTACVALPPTPTQSPTGTQSPTATASASPTGALSPTATASASPSNNNAPASTAAPAGMSAGQSASVSAGVAAAVSFAGVVLWPLFLKVGPRLLKACVQAAQQRPLPQTQFSAGEGWPEHPVSEKGQPLLTD